MWRRLTAGILFLAWSSITLAWSQTPQYHLEFGPGRAFQCRETGAVKLTNPDFIPVEWHVAAATPPELANQEKPTSEVWITEFGKLPSSSFQAEGSPLHRTICWASLTRQQCPNSAHGLSWTVIYQAALHPYGLAPGPAAVDTIEPLDTLDRAAYLSEDTIFDFSKPDLQTWMKNNKLLRQQGEDDLSFAWRIYDFLTHTLVYNRQELALQASVVCKIARGDCGGMSSLFVALMRANGIPARMITGFWVTSGKSYDRGHAKAQFYATGIGWVPVDVSGKVFGQDKGNFLALYIDSALVLPDKEMTPRLQLLHLHVTGSGSTECTFESSWHAYPLPPE